MPAFRLTDSELRKAQPAGRQFKLPDGQNLHLLIMPNGSKLWQVRYRLNGKARVYSAGPYPDVSLDAARDAASKVRETVRAGHDPVAARLQQRALLARHRDSLADRVPTLAKQITPQQIKTLMDHMRMVRERLATIEGKLARLERTAA